MASSHMGPGDTPRAKALVVWVLVLWKLLVKVKACQCHIKQGPGSPKTSPESCVGEGG